MLSVCGVVIGHLREFIFLTPRKIFDHVVLVGIECLKRIENFTHVPLCICSSGQLSFSTRCDGYSPRTVDRCILVNLATKLANEKWMTTKALVNMRNNSRRKV